MTLAERWDGAAWSLIAPRVPAGASSSELDRVSCVSGGQCMAVGHDKTAAGEQPLAELWNGSGWAIERVPLPAGDIGAARRRRVHAARQLSGSGRYSSALLPLLEHWDGTRLSQLPLSLPAGTTGGRLTAVSCASTTACTAAGPYFGPTGAKLEAEAWNGRTWTAQRLPVPSGTTEAQLNGLSCPTATMCAAIGYVTASGRVRSIASMLGPVRGWSTLFTPTLPRSSGVVLQDVACSSPSACTAVGIATVSGVGGIMTAVRYAGTAWVLEPVPAPNPNSDDLDAVSCVAATTCVSVGSYTGARFQTLAEVWGGPAWSALPVPAPPSLKSANLFGTSCATISDCVAVGVWENTSGLRSALAEGWNGSSWRILPAIPLPKGGIGGTLYSVSCPLVNQCVAVGSYQSADGLQLLPLAEAWNGVSWTLLAPAAPAARFAELFGVSCRNIGLCMAVGYQIGTLGAGSVPLSEDLESSTWTIRSVALPTQSSDAALNSVSCDVTEFCRAVGWSNNAHQTAPLSESWTGSWSIDTVPDPPGSLDSPLNGVSCSPFSDFNNCTAAGLTSDAEGIHASPLAESLVSGAWSLASPSAAPAGDLYGAQRRLVRSVRPVHGRRRRRQRHPSRPSGATDRRPLSRETVPDAGSTQVLHGVSCTATITCMAVGWFDTTAGTEPPLSDIYS